MAALHTSPEQHFFSPGSLSNQSGPSPDEYAHNPRFQELQTTLRSYLIDEARGAGDTHQRTLDRHDDLPTCAPGTQSLAHDLHNPQDQVLVLKKVKYMNIWISECAPWLDMFDQERHFGIQIPILAQRSPAVLYALLALAARQTERSGGSTVSSQDSLDLYSRAISSLAPSINARDPQVLITACILCVLEMMSVSPRDWRRHLEGCAALLETAGVNGLSGGLLQAVFWCYARMDLCAAIIADGAESTTLPVDKWALLDPDMDTSPGVLDQQQLISKAFLERGATVPDMHANYAVYLCARVCDLLSRRTRHVELGEDNGCTDSVFRLQWKNRWDELRQWFERRPPQMQSIQEIDASHAEDLFPTILFAYWAAISGNQLYHTACILMMEMMPPQIDAAADAADLYYKPLWHARRIVGISLTNPHRGCLNNAIQPLYVAGKLFTHRDEHKIIVDLLNHIEARSGWGSRWRIKDLEAFWGYRSGRRAGNVER